MNWWFIEVWPSKVLDLCDFCGIWNHIFNWMNFFANKNSNCEPINQFNKRECWKSSKKSQNATNKWQKIDLIELLPADNLIKDILFVLKPKTTGLKCLIVSCSEKLFNSIFKSFVNKLHCSYCTGPSSLYSKLYLTYSQGSKHSQKPFSSSKSSSAFL